MPIRELNSHPEHYVTVGELADYWAVSRQQIYKQIESGALVALRLGPRLYRVPTTAAIEFERAVGVNRGREREPKLHLTSRLPRKIGPQRVPVPLSRVKTR